MTHIDDYTEFELSTRQDSIDRLIDFAERGRDRDIEYIFDEKLILDAIEKILDFPILRQFGPIRRSFVDGYAFDLNLVIEIDGGGHYRNNVLSEEDILRQNKIIDYLKCYFLRIKQSEIIIGGILDVLKLERIINEFCHNNIGMFIIEKRPEVQL